MDHPLVAIITPVYNGGAYLKECLGAVRAQTYPHWVHVVVDNVSTDDSYEIAQAMAAEDDRIQVVRETEHLGMLANWNRAMTRAPGHAVYLKQLNADDELRPECLEKMVAAAEAHPEAGIISSGFILGTEPRPIGANGEARLCRGREVVRDVFLRGIDYLGQPSVVLVRKSATNGVVNAMFDPAGFPPGHADQPPMCLADKEAYFPILEESDLYFLPEVLADMRVEEDSATAYSARVGAWHASRLELLLKHGSGFLEKDELKDAIRASRRKYVRSLTFRFLKGVPLHDPVFNEYQRLSLGYLIPALRKAGFGGEAAWLMPFYAMIRCGKRPSR